MPTATPTKPARKSPARKSATVTPISKTAAQLNAETTAARAAQARAANASQNTAPKTPATRKSAAAKSPAKPVNGKTPSGKTVAKPRAAATPKPAPKPEPKMPWKRALAVLLIDAGAELAQTAEVDGATADEIAEQIGKWLAYLPATPTWPTEILGPRSDAGRRPAVAS